MIYFIFHIELTTILKTIQHLMFETYSETISTAIQYCSKVVWRQIHENELWYMGQNIQGWTIREYFLLCHLFVSGKLLFF